jgi:hypothetical protein
MYRLQPHRTIAHEIERIADRQLMLALFGLRRAGTPHDDAAVAEACRHITKVRALMGLVRSGLGDGTYVPAHRRLAAVERRLAPIADGRAVFAALARLAIERDAIGAGVALQSVRDALVARAARVDRKAIFDRVLPRCARTLTVERARVGTWVLDAREIRAIAPGLADSMRRATEAMASAIERPTAARFEVWGRRTRELSLHVRLIEGRCTGLRAIRLRLDALDDCLGECHNVAVLERVLTTEAFGSRGAAATVLRLLRRYRAGLRARALTLGGAALRDTPQQFVRRVVSHWRADRVPGPRRSRTRRVRHAA